VPLTTIEQPRHEIGVTAATLLLDRLDGRRTRLDRVVVSTRLIVRRSTVKDPMFAVVRAPEAALTAR
jgi:DNA-binding LacI/PurR family transcriptional regulator